MSVFLSLLSLAGRNLGVAIGRASSSAASGVKRLTAGPAARLRRKTAANNRRAKELQALKRAGKKERASRAALKAARRR